MSDGRPQSPGPARPGQPARPGDPGQEDLTQRINAAYASSQPIVPDDGGAPKKPGGSGRFAAAVGAATGRDKGASTSKPAPTVSTSSTGSSGSTKPPVKRVRKAHLRLTHVDPWSVMKTAFLLSVALGIVTVVAVGVVWAVLGAADVWGSIDSTVADVVGENGDTFRVEDYLGMSRVLGFTMIVAVIDVVLVTVIATLGAFLYNLAAALLGGIEVVLAEDDR